MGSTATMTKTSRMREAIAAQRKVAARMAEAEAKPAPPPVKPAPPATPVPEPISAPVAAEPTPKKARKKFGNRPPMGRLPNGARFTMTYAAETTTWSGALTIPQPGREPFVAHGTAAGLFALCQRLDGYWREHLAGGGPEQTDVPDVSARP